MRTRTNNNNNINNNNNNNDDDDDDDDDGNNNDNNNVQVTQIESLVLNTKKQTAEPAAKQERVPHQSATARLASTAARPTATEQVLTDSAFSFKELWHSNGLYSHGP